MSSKDRGGVNQKTNGREASQRVAAEQPVSRACAGSEGQGRGSLAKRRVRRDGRGLTAQLDGASVPGRYVGFIQRAVGSRGWLQGGGDAACVCLRKFPLKAARHRATWRKGAWEVEELGTSPWSPQPLVPSRPFQGPLRPRPQPSRRGPSGCRAPQTRRDSSALGPCHMLFSCLADMCSEQPECPLRTPSCLPLCCEELSALQMAPAGAWLCHGGDNPLARSGPPPQARGLLRTGCASCLWILSSAPGAEQGTCRVGSQGG